MPTPLVTEESREDLAVRGQAVYDHQLRAKLEPAYNNQYVVLHVDTGDYAIGKSFTQANRTMMARYPASGRLFGRKIGPEPDTDFIARRLLAARSQG